MFWIDTDKLEEVQRQAARFITRECTSRGQDCVSQMLAELNLPPLQDKSQHTISLLQGGGGAGAGTAVS